MLVHTICSHLTIASRAKSVMIYRVVCLHKPSATHPQSKPCWLWQLALDRIPFEDCLGPVRSHLWWHLQLALWWSLFENASASVRSGDIFSGFIYLISGSNSTVGYIQGINGCMQASLVGSCPIIMPKYGLVKTCPGLGHLQYHGHTCKGI